MCFFLYAQILFLLDVFCTKMHTDKFSNNGSERNNILLKSDMFINVLSIQVFFLLLETKLNKIFKSLSSLHVNNLYSTIAV